jgi:hypothetical protein
MGIVGIHNLRVERESGASLDALYRFAGNPATDDEDRCIYQVIANPLVGDVDELVAEKESGLSAVAVSRSLPAALLD